MRMAVGGMTREELDRELDAVLGPEERTELLDDVFGTPRVKRVGGPARTTSA
jgi:hypothetical protein